MTQTIILAPEPTNWKIVQGDPWGFAAIYKDSLGRPIPLDRYTSRLQVRPTPNSPILLCSLDSTIPDPDGSLIITPSQGRVDALVKTEITTIWTYLRVFYDLRIFDLNGQGKALVYGRIDVVPQVTV